jgi:uncharacterized protein (DUF362 family)
VKAPTRRLVVAGGVGAAVGVGVVGVAGALAERRQERATVRLLRVDGYDERLGERLAEELGAFPRLLGRVPGARVLLKPNLVEAREGRPVCTEAAFIVGVAEAFLRRGAASVRVGEGPGHCRDTEEVLSTSGVGEALRARGLGFVDLNVDDVVALRPPADLSGHGRIPVARTVRGADLLVSLPRLKTHHHSGVSLSMKNLFGAVSGSVWGWPKNPLHQGGIEHAIVDLWTGLEPAFTIVDGLVGMEGDGPILGEPVVHGMVLMGEHAPAVDATAARLMGVDPEALRAFRLVAAHGGTVAASRIDVEGDTPVWRQYRLPGGFAGARLWRWTWRG